MFKMYKYIKIVPTNCILVICNEFKKWDENQKENI